MKFTAIYEAIYCYAPDPSYITEMRRIYKRDGETVRGMLEREGLEEDILFLFHGHPAQEGEEGMAPDGLPPKSDIARMIGYAIDAEPELDGSMPSELWDKLQTREEVTAAMRAVVAATKAGILKRVLECIGAGCEDDQEKP